MRGRVERQGAMFVSLDMEELVPADHPLRAIRKLAEAELVRLRPHFEAAYARVGRPSIPPEQLIKASLIQALYSIRSERQLCEQIAYNFLFRWFLELSPEAPAWNHSTFAKNRERFAEHGLLRRFFEGSVAHAIQREAIGCEHFSVDGTLLQAWGSMKSFRPTDQPPDDPQAGPRVGANGWVNFHGHKRSNATHHSRTDPQARLARKGAGREAILAHVLHGLMDNRHGLLLDLTLSEANGTAERSAALSLLRRVRRRHWLCPLTLGADKGYDAGPFLETLEHEFGVEPHVALRRAAPAGRAFSTPARLRLRAREQDPAYQASQRCRRRIEQAFSWIKGVAGLRKARFAGRWKIELQVLAAAAGYNLLRLARLARAAPA